MVILIPESWVDLSICDWICPWKRVYLYQDGDWMSRALNTCETEQCTQLPLFRLFTVVVLRLILLLSATSFKWCLPRISSMIFYSVGRCKAMILRNTSETTWPDVDPVSHNRESFISLEKITVYYLLHFDRSSYDKCIWFFYVLPILFRVPCSNNNIWCTMPNTFTKT